jgi:tellurite resistance protein TehA-like permease
MAGTLILESIVVLLALPVVSVVGGGLSAGSTAYLVGVAVVLILMAGVQGRPWALKANIGIQFVLVAGAFIHITIGFIGVLFVLVWVLIAYLKAEVKRRQERGLLPGQQPPPSD